MNSLHLILFKLSEKLIFNDKVRKWNIDNQYISFKFLCFTFIFNIFLLILMDFDIFSAFSGDFVIWLKV